MDGSHDRYLYENSDWQAAQTLMDIAAEATRVQNRYGVGGGNRLNGSLGVLCDHEPQSQVEDTLTDSEMTISIAEDEERMDDDPDARIPEVAVDEQGLVLGYFIARRNPTRAARPSSKMTD